LQLLNLTKNKQILSLLSPFFRFYSVDFQPFSFIFWICICISLIFSCFLLFLSFLFIMFTRKHLFQSVNFFHIRHIGNVTETFSCYFNHSKADICFFYALILQFQVFISCLPLPFLSVLFSFFFVLLCSLHIYNILQRFIKKFSLSLKKQHVLSCCHCFLSMF